MVAFYFLSTTHKMVCMEVFVAGSAPNHGVVIRIPAGVTMNHNPLALRRFPPLGTRYLKWGTLLPMIESWRKGCLSLRSLGV
jgi:hypothetical protein